MKKGYCVFSFILFGIILCNFISALAVSPAKIEINFQPGFEETFGYRVEGISDSKEMDLSLEGDLAKYAELDKDYLVGPSSFNVHLKLPDQIDSPGKNRIKVVVSERPDEEIGMVGTVVRLKVAIDVFVPYPGRYIEVSNFMSNNANVGEPVEFSFTMINRGKEDLTVNPKIEIVGLDGNIIETLLLKERELAVTESLALKKVLNTSNYLPSEYEGVLVLDYGETTQANWTFRVGTLILYIKNSTKEILLSESIEKFDIEIENGWNDKIDGAYADVVISNTTSEVANFKTTTTDLQPWEKRIITGYFDTKNLQEGDYEAKITLHYFGKEVGESSTESVHIKLVAPEKTNWFLIVSIVLVCFILILLAVYIGIKKFKSRKKKK